VYRQSINVESHWSRAMPNDLPDCKCIVARVSNHHRRWQWIEWPQAHNQPVESHQLNLSLFLIMNKTIFILVDLLVCLVRTSSYKCYIANLKEQYTLLQDLEIKKMWFFKNYSESIVEQNKGDLRNLNGIALDRMIRGHSNFKGGGGWWFFFAYWNTVYNGFWK